MEKGFPVPAPLAYGKRLRLDAESSSACDHYVSLHVKAGARSFPYHRVIHVGRVR